MALFTDGNLNTIDNLRVYETGIVNVAVVEGIDLNSKLTLATDETGAEILAFLLREWPRDPLSAARRIIGLGGVVVTPPLVRWHVLVTLALVYSDAHNNQLNDRYLGKWQAYKQMANAAGLRYFQDGIGLAVKPVPAAAAPSLSSAAGTLAGQTYFASVTWSSSVAEEGSPSVPLSFDTGIDGLLVVVPPAAPPVATGWNVYAGVTAGGMTRQNSSPLALNSSWIMPATGLVNGVPVTTGQPPDIYLADQHRIPRG
ncbi:MAG: hypothetical protein ABI165_01800 [Bryobacteraceae bacterium]